MSATFSITANSLRKDYGDRTVLDADGLTLESGHVYALVGPNGSGKSTFLKVLSGVMDQTSGSADVSGIDRDELAVGYMPQKSYVFGFSVLKNVMTFSWFLQASGSGRFSLNHLSISRNVFSSSGFMTPSRIIRQHMLKIPFGYFVTHESSLPWILIYLHSFMCSSACSAAPFCRSADHTMNASKEEQV